MQKDGCKKREMDVLFKNGSRVTGLQTIDNKQYYFGPDGFMQTGWVDIGGAKYYANKSGALQKVFSILMVKCIILIKVVSYPEVCNK